MQAKEALMPQDDQLVYKLLAVLLEYPDAAWQAALADLDQVVAGLQDADQRQTFRNFFSQVAATAPDQLEQAYTATFDLDPATSLNLTYHLLGDSEDRGKALAALLRLYGQQGFELAERQLPDYLPLVFEFLSLSSGPQEHALLNSCLGTIAPLAERLEKKQQHVHAGLVRMGADLVQRHTPSTTAHLSKEP